MKIHKNELLQLHGNKMPIDREVALHLKGRHPQIIDAGPARFAGEAYTTSGLYMVEGHVAGELTMECARCLEPFTYAYRETIKETFVDEKAAEIEIDEEMEIHPLENDQLDLQPHLEGAVLLSVPSVLICKDDCKGICPECGTNRNRKSCGCVVERIDPRLAVLGELFGKQDK
ncbi:YceD family protein [Aneurinibacillus terranovensis]|uniref:YceD family protein n=1 Tax=Aneurinibacillus terranovensis TaxID=278991 RepID=UPI00041F94E6|nr:DUF177 domain-containing protein [Aneurinibacillus terranovensis]